MPVYPQLSPQLSPQPHFLDETYTFSTALLPPFYPSQSTPQPSLFNGIINTRPPRRITHAHGRAARVSPPLRPPSGTTPHKRRKRLNYAPSAPLRLILPPTQQHRPHSRRKPAMQPHDIKSNSRGIKAALNAR